MKTPDSSHRHERPDLEEDLELYVLGMLSPEEEAEIEAYLRDHPEAETRLHDLQETSAELALSLDPMSPPEGLKSRIVEQARADAVPEQPRSLAEARARSLDWRPWAVAAVLLIAVGGLLVWNLRLQQELDERATIERHAIEILDQSRVAGGEILIIEDQDLAVLSLEDLAQPGSQQVYQLWYIEGGQPEPAQTFLPDPQGNASVSLKDDLSGAQAVAVTVEPQGGSSAPTSAPILQGTLGNDES